MAWAGEKLGAWLAGLISGVVFEAESGWDGEGFWTAEAGFWLEAAMGLASGTVVVDDLGFEVFKGSAGSKPIEKFSSIGANDYLW